METKALEDEVWAAVQAMNRAWTTDRRPERLAEYFHPEMVAVPGNGRLRLEGRAACVAAWKGFADAARVTRWEEREPKVQIWAGGAAAVVHYYFEMTFELGGRAIDADGRDTFVLVNDDGRWWIVADHFSAYPA